jgi:glycerol uptake facilitator-like aquaporin
MFGEALWQMGGTDRSGLSLAVAEVVATFGLLMTIAGCRRFRPEATALAVGLYITAGYWFTSSTCFANPAVTVARSLTGTFAGIRPADVPLFLAAETVGLGLALVVASWLWGRAGAGTSSGVPARSIP